MFSCKQVDELISRSMDKKLSLRQRFMVRIHMRVCTYCQTYKRQMLALREALRCYQASLEAGECEPDATLSEEARKRITESMKRE